MPVAPRRDHFAADHGRFGVADKDGREHIHLCFPELGKRKDAAALAYYADHPEHVKVKEFVRTVVKARKCVDFEI